MAKKTFRNIVISLFVIVWLGVFHYESLRAFYLNPYFKKELPKLKFLFPPAGWIMFYTVDDAFGYVEVLGLKDGGTQLIDPHDIFRTRTILFDNIHRGILSTVANRRRSAQFCRFLKYRFPEFENFLITGVFYPHLTVDRYDRDQRVQYQCSPQ